MKALLFAAAMALPAMATATVAMDPLQAASSQETVQPRRVEGSAHRQLFIVRYELRRPSADTAPQIIMDDASPQIVPPLAGGYPATTLGAAQADPNTIVCYGRGCESRQR
jgi:hypothetical protein